MITTPRTDAKRIEGHPSLKEEEVAWAFASQLERELNAFKANNLELIERHNSAILSWDEERERALREGARVIEWRARAEKAEAKINELERDVYCCSPCSENDYEGMKWCDAFDELEKENAALRMDKERLDWIAKNRSVSLTEKPLEVSPESLRAAIDAAMKEASK